jgi:SpoVK/Ycf46/Vps4 family AAA+-type ATPase
MLRKLVERIDPRSGDVTLHAEVRRQLLPLFAGKGVALFSGPGGTGKTLAALALARELGTDVLRIDLSSLVSKYLGETEKHLDAVFADAEQSGAVLLLDEADALLGKRSQVGDSNDRYANVEVSYLLERLEAFRGVAILTSNARSNIDEECSRRLRLVVEFPPPG